MLLPDDSSEPCEVFGDLDALEQYIASGQAARDWRQGLRNGQQCLEDAAHASDEGVPTAPRRRRGRGE